MVQQMQQVCSECRGSGKTIKNKDRCPQCKGEKVVPEKKVLEVAVEKGMQHGQKITFPGVADEAPDTDTAAGMIEDPSGEVGSIARRRTRRKTRLPSRLLS